MSSEYTRQTRKFKRAVNHLRRRVKVLRRALFDKRQG